MAQERVWRPADYWQETMSAPPPPPQTREMTRAWEAPDDRSSAERPGNLRESARKGNNITAWNIVAWALPCGFVVGVVAAVVALLLLHVA